MVLYGLIQLHQSGEKIVPPLVKVIHEDSSKTVHMFSHSMACESVLLCETHSIFMFEKTIYLCHVISLSYLLSCQPRVTVMQYCVYNC